MENLKPTYINIKEKYLDKIDSDGFLRIGEFANQELKRQSKSVAGLVDGEEGTNPEIFFGRGLRYKGSAGNYPDMKIHIDDLEEFIKRVKEYFVDK